MYKNIKFELVLSDEYDEDDFYCNFYWGIRGVNVDITQKPKIFEGLKAIVLSSNLGLHNSEDNSVEWAVSDYADRDEVKDIYLQLVHLISASNEIIVDRII